MSVEAFLNTVQRRAYRMALLATRNPDDALDIVQDAMTRLVQNYRNKPAGELPMLFQRILQHKIVDWHRKQQRMNSVFGFAKKFDEDDDIELLEAPNSLEPAHLLSRAADVECVINAVEKLPLRQQQAFLLRAWESYSTADTAVLMQCSEASVKTHYFRAIHRLRDTLEAI